MSARRGDGVYRMKNMRKLLALLTALILALGCLTAWADGEPMVEPTNHTLTIYYIYAGGDVARDPYIGSVAEGEEYNVPSPTIEDYTPDVMYVTGHMGTSDVTETVTYTQIIPAYTLTIYYVYADGTEAAEMYCDEAIEKGKEYEVESPAVEGYTPDKAKVSGTMGADDVTVTVTYTANHTHTYGTPAWAWDGTSAKATFTCTANDDTQTIDATVTPVTTPATCTAAGKTVYTA